MPESNINIEVSFPNFPEGWQGSPQELVQWIAENALFSATGEFLTGQIGGARPTTNIGIYVNGRQIEVWDDTLSEYVPMTTAQIGSVMDFPSAQALPPDNYLFAEGQLLVIEDYQELYDVIGREWTGSTDPLTSFRIPDYRGRAAVGSGLGDYNPKAEVSGVLNGRMAERQVGDYFGQEWPTVEMTTPPNSPTPRASAELKGTGGDHTWNKTTFNTVVQPRLAVRKIIRVR